MTTTRRIGCIGTLVAALALAGCSTPVEKPETGKPAQVVLPQDCTEVTSINYDSKNGTWVVAYKSNAGNYVTQRYDASWLANKVEWIVPTPEKPLEQKVQE